MASTNQADIYSFSFEILDEVRLADCVVEPGEEVGTDLDQAISEDTEIALPANIGTTALSGVAELAPSDDQTEVMGVITLSETRHEPVEKVVMEATVPVTEKQRPEPSEAAVLLATEAIDAYLKGSPRPVVALAELSHIAFGKRIPSKAFKDFARAVHTDIRLMFTDSGDFRVMVDKDGKFIREDDLNENVISPAQMSWLADQAIATLLEAAPYPQVTPKQLLGTVSSFGMFLTNDEIHEFFAKVASDSRLVPLPDGSFRFLDVLVDKVKEVSPLSTAEIRKEQKEEKTAEIRAIKDSGKKAKANPRIRGKNFRKKGSRMQGRAHNQTKSIDQLLAEMNADQSAGKKKA